MHIQKRKNKHKIKRILITKSMLVVITTIKKIAKYKKKL